MVSSSRTKYEEYLDSPHWHKLRKRLVPPGSKCCICESSDTLQLHHVNYGRVGDERDSDLLRLCRKCHERLHEALDTQFPGKPTNFKASRSSMVFRATFSIDFETAKQRHLNAILPDRQKPKKKRQPPPTKKQLGKTRKQRRAAKIKAAIQSQSQRNRNASYPLGRPLITSATKFKPREKPPGWFLSREHFDKIKERIAARKSAQETALEVIPS